MNAQQQLQLEDAQKKLSVFRKHLDLLARCIGESKNVDPNEVLSAVAELQTLVEWAAQQPELEAESAVLLVKLQELYQIRENLEKTSAEADEYSSSKPALNYGAEITIPEKSETYSKDLEYISDIVAANLYDNNGENLEDDSISMGKDSLGDCSASTEDPNIAKAESPESIEDTNVDIIPRDDKSDHSVTIHETDDSHPRNEQKDTLSNEGARKKNLEVQETLAENKIEILESSPSFPEVKSPNLFRSDVIIIETDEDNKSTEFVNDSKNSDDPLDVCMYAIRNLYESLRVKENELLKLSAMQNDQKHIEALQAVIIDFHKDITNLNIELDKSKKENLMLKEQVLELEEAENDARSEAQKLEQKLAFLQEKDSHSQAELSQMKQTLKKSNEMLAEKEVLEKELRSQIKYMETLVQKYEDQIKVMEAKKISNPNKGVENFQKQENGHKTSCEKRVICNKGTQTYQPRETKINCNGDTPVDSNNMDASLTVSQKVQILEESKEIVDKKTENNDPSTSSVPCTSANETTQSEEKGGFINIENISQKELLKRLHKLIDEDVSLQQQIHYVDEINLAMWKKLKKLDNHIGECKRQNINETNLVVSEAELNSNGGRASDREIQEPSDFSTNPSIPEENLSCLDQSEQYIQERLTKLEEINASFEKELKTRENLYKEKEKKYEEWMETEKRIMDDLKRFTDERDWIIDQVTKLNREQEVRQTTIHRLEGEINALKEKNQTEITKISADQEKTTEPLNFKVNQMLTKEKEILKMIANLKSEKNRSQGRSELERLKCNYIELQLELSQAREEIRKIEEKYKLRLDECTSKHLLEDTHRISELERLRSENARSEKMISNLQTKKNNLLSALEKQEKYLQKTRESYKKNLEETEEVHRCVETELKSHLQEIEEGTAIATTALMEERMKVEKELQENIKDLKAKEEVYKAKIAELEHDVSNLHEELHKIEAEPDSKTDLNPKEITAESESKVAQIQETTVEDVNENNIEKPCSKVDLNVMTQSAPLSKTIEDDVISHKENTMKESTPPIKLESLNGFEIKGNVAEKNVTQENVDELRAQVRELQSELEKISGEEIPPVQPLNPITAKSLKMQKVEDIDYAEVDECSFDAWRKNMQNISVSTSIPPNIQAFSGDKYSTGYKDNLQNERVSVKEPVEENDYDEVLPRPTNFHVVQQVGSDTLLVGWNYVNPSVLDGFEVYLDDQVHERIYIPDRTKALISGLNLRKPIRLSICALSRYGQMSEPTVLELSSQEFKTQYFEGDDEYRDIEDPMKRSQRPYSMEW